MRPFEIEVTYFRAQGLTNAYASPAVLAEQFEAASDLFDAVDINLSFKDGGTVSGDPWRKQPWIERRVLFSRPEAADTGRRVVLLLSQTHIDSDNINGMLAHRSSRSVMSCLRIRRDLSLGRRIVTSKFSCTNLAMRSAARRGGDSASSFGDESGLRAAKWSQ